MTDSKKGLPRLDEGDLYESLSGVLQRLLQRKFAIPPEDGKRLVDEVFIVYLGLLRAPPDAKAWLIAGARQLAITYLKTRGLNTGGVGRQTEAARQSLLLEEAMALLPERARNVLLLRFTEGKTYAEIAAELGVRVRSAKRIVARAAAVLRGLMKSR